MADLHFLVIGEMERMAKAPFKSSKSEVIAARFPNSIIHRLQLMVERTSIKRNDLIVTAVDQALQSLESNENLTAISEKRSPFSHN